jgi:drug/metabolite transporter (DMT)-like permease
MGIYACLGFCLAAFFAAMFWAGDRASALSLATIYVTVPLLTYFLGLAFAVERRDGQRLAMLALGAAGALGLDAIGPGGAAGAPRFGPGEMAFLAGCAATALYPVVSRWGLERGWLTLPAGLRTFWSLVMGALLIGVLGLFVEEPRRLAAMTPRDGLLLAYLAAFGSACTFWLMQRATAVLRPATVTAYSYLVPFTSLLLLLASRPGALGWGWLPGSAMVLLAMGLLMRGDSGSLPTRFIPRR